MCNEPLANMGAMCKECRKILEDDSYIDTKIFFSHSHKKKKFFERKNLPTFLYLYSDFSLGKILNLSTAGYAINKERAALRLW